jgi:uncharacterized protein (TIGR02246 family)
MPRLVRINSRGLDALVGFWTEDAEFIRESGKTFRGREAIRSLLESSLAGNKGNKQSITATSIRFVRPDVAATTPTRRSCGRSRSTSRTAARTPRGAFCWGTTTWC